MRVRWNVAVLTLFVTLLILFGGFFGYQRWEVELPIRQAVAKNAHVKLQQLAVQPDRVTIHLKTEAGFSLTRDYVDLRKSISQLAGNRKLHLVVHDRPAPALNDAWDEMVFGIEEGIAHQRYTRIPQAVKQAAKPRNIRYRVTMDDQFLYVELRRDQYWLYRVLPLNKPGHEVKDNG
jgi:hypothetical protein